MNDNAHNIDTTNSSNEDLKSQPIIDNSGEGNVYNETIINSKAQTISDSSISSKSASNMQNGKKSILIALIAISVIVIAIILLLLGNGSNGGIFHNHSYGDWETVSYATCTSIGEKERYCTCGDIQAVTINKISHNYGEWTITKEATCVVEGLRERECDCGEKESASIPKTNIHNEITISAIPATCTSTGLTEGKKCSICAKITLEQETIEKASHVLYETIAVVATSTSQGTKTLSCKNCNYSYSEKYSVSVLSSEEVYELAEYCVGEITIYNKSGSAISLGTVFVYSYDGKLLTNYHVIDGGYSAKVTLNGKTYTVNSVLAYDKDIDLAILKINASDLFAPIIQTEGIRGGSKVYAVGSSEGYTLSFSTGVIASPSRTIDGVEYIQHEAAISHGNSGGPLFNEYGEVIGINTLSHIDGQNLNFAIACNEIENLSFNTALTFKQFYEKECDVFEKLKNYIIETGTYYGDYYKVLLDITYSSDYTSKFSRYAYYYIDDDVITLDLLINDGEYWTYFTIDHSIDGSYTWNYLDENSNKMRGTLYATTYNSDTLLVYSYNNVSSFSLRTSIRELASSMVAYLCKNIDDDFREIGVTAEDLQFCYY